MFNEEKRETKYVPYVLWGTIAFVFGPYLLHVIGIDFSTNIFSFDAVEGSQFFLNKSFDAFKESAYTFLRGAFIHTLLEWSAFVLALMTAFMSFIHYKAHGNPIVPIMGSVFLVSGCLDAYHLLVSNHLIDIPAVKNEILAISWAICRLYNSIALLTCGLYLLNHKKLSNTRLQGITLRTWMFSIISVSFAIGGIIILNNLSNPEIVMEMISLNKRIVGPLELLPIMVLVISLPIFVKIYREEKSHFTFSILLSIMPALFTHIYMGVGSTQRYDAFFNLSQFTEIQIYVVPFLGIVLDYLVTSENMKLSEVKFRNLYMGSSDSVFLMNSIGIFDCNKAALDLFLFENVNAISGHHLYELSPKHQPSGETSSLEGKKKYAEVFEDNCSHYEWMFRRKDGTYFEADVMMKRIKVNDISFIQVVVRDITHKKTQERMAKKEMIDATQTAKLAALGEMSDGISHELNNPLAIIGACASKINRMIKYDSLDHNRLEQLVNKINTTTIRAAKIVKGFQQFTMDTVEADFNDYTLDEIIEKTKQLCGKKLQNDEINLVIENKEVLTASCQISQVCQILLNLINNAKDIALGLEENWVKIIVEEKDKTITLRVIDPGHGIADDVVEKMYNPFFTTKQVGAGTGLGVSISKNIAHSQKGELYYELYMGHTSFVLELPKGNAQETSQTYLKAA